MAALVFALTVSALPATQAFARPFETGIVSTDSETQTEPLAMNRMKDAGTRYLKVAAFWSNIAPSRDSPDKPPSFDATDPGHPGYNWSAIDTAVREAAAAGLEPLLTVTDSPRWARQPGCTEQPICYPDPQEYADFATAIARRYSGSFDPGNGVLPRVRYWQAWVEPNLVIFFLPQFENGQKVSPDNYRRLLNAFSGAVKAVDPSNRVLMAGLAPLKRPGGLGPLDFTRRLLCMQGRKKPKPEPGCDQSARFDIAATHPYTTGGPTHKAAGADDVSLGNLPLMTKLIRAANRAGKIQTDGGVVPFWVTEFSWDSKPPDPGGLKSKLHARWMAESFFRMWKAGVSAVLWFGLRDQARGEKIGDTAQSGLYLRGSSIAKDKAKRSLKSFRFPFVALRKGRKILVWGRTPDSGPGKVRVEQNSGSGFRKIATLKANSDGIFTRKVRSGETTGKVRAKLLGGSKSLPFSLKYVKDFYVPPFGGKGQTPNTGVG
ncbi:MAG: hypothetical protein AABM29_01335 [Actinomycetota bacterium]